MKINTDPLNMDALDFDGHMWGPEYVIRNSRSQW